MSVSYLSSQSLPATPAAPAELAGFVLDLGSGSTLNGVEIEIQPIGVRLRTDLDGVFRVKLPAGTYSLVASKDGYLTQTVTGVTLVSDQETWQEVPIQPAGGVANTVIEVTAGAVQATNIALIQERKSAGTLTEAIGRLEMARITGGDGADVMQRVTGISVVDNKFVFVRGLGERYSATQLNGSQIPSTQPDKKVIAMDLFPSALLESIQTEKSYTPDQPGEFAGGLVKVNALDFPSRATLKISYGTDLNTNTTFRPFREYPGGISIFGDSMTASAICRISSPTRRSSKPPDSLPVSQHKTSRPLGEPSPMSGNSTPESTPCRLRSSVLWAETALETSA